MAPQTIRELITILTSKSQQVEVNIAERFISFIEEIYKIMKIQPVPYFLAGTITILDELPNDGRYGILGRWAIR